MSDCSLTHGKQCFFPEDYNSSGYTEEEEDHNYWVLAEDVGCNFSFSLGQDLSLEKAESIKSACEDEGSGIRITVMRQ